MYKVPQNIENKFNRKITRKKNNYNTFLGTVPFIEAMAENLRNWG
jgi:hypothetical protein